MPQPKYDIIFEGRFVEGAAPARVRARIGQIFRIGPEDAEKLFSGRRIVIKRNVDLSEAQRFKNLMRKAGAACRLVPQDVPLRGFRVADSNRPDTKNARPAPLKSEKVRQAPGPTAAGDRKKPGRSRWLQMFLAALAVVAVVGFTAFWQESGPMPADAATLDTFVAGFREKLLEVEAGRSRAVTYVNVAQSVIEQMGYDYDQTLLHWSFNRALHGDARRRSIHDNYLIGPLKVLYELDAEQMRSCLAPETYAALENALGIGEYITLRSIRMLRECARGAALVQHEALVDGLRKFDITVDADFPEMAIEEAFYGLRYNGLIQINTRRQWKAKRVELQILDRAQITAQEKRLERLETLCAQHTRHL